MSLYGYATYLCVSCAWFLIYKMLLAKKNHFLPKQNKTKLLDAIVLIWVITSSYCIKILLCAFPPVLPVIDLWIDSAQLSKHHCNQQLCTLIIFVIISLGMSPPRSRRAGSYVVYLLNLILSCQITLLKGYPQPLITLMANYLVLYILLMCLV